MRSPRRRGYTVLAFALSVLVGCTLPVSEVAVSAAFAGGSPAGDPASSVQGGEDADAHTAPEGSDGGEAGSGTDAGTDSDVVAEDDGHGAPDTGADDADDTDDAGEAAESPAPEASAEQVEQAPLALTALGIPAPTTSAPAASGPIPKMTSAWTPVGAQPSGTTRTATVVYENTGSAPIANGRIWQQYMARVGHSTTYTVSCVAANGAACPAPGVEGMPSGSQTITAADREYPNLFWAVVNLPVGGKLTFTIVATTTVLANVCADSDEVMVGTWSRYSRTGFVAPDDLDASASSVGAIKPVTQCGDGVVQMTNKVTSPGPEANPARVLSTDSRVFVATWKNTSASSRTVPIKYTYYVPYTGQDTEASWSCVSSTGSCPGWAASGSRHIDHDSPGEEDDVVFGDSITSGTATANGVPVTLAAGQTLTFTITLATTLNTCTQDGYLRVQSYATRGAASGETAGFRTQASSKLVEIGCSTWLMTEDFSGTTVTDSAWKGLNEACLTRAASGATVTNGLGYCTNRTQVPPTTFDPASTGLPKGYLKLTDAQGSKSGAALYDRPLPSKNGLVLEFTQYQYGGNGADGIGFFLTDGNHSLTATGADGGALGYGAKGGNQNGLANAYLGIGFDTYGNFSADNDGGGNKVSCTVNGPGLTSNSVALRGPGAKNSSGQWRNDYCFIAGKKVSDISSSYSLRHSTGTLSSNTDFQGALNGAKRKTRVTVYPLKDNETVPKVTVEVDFGSGYITVIDQRVTVAAPALIKFGFLGSTGGSTDAHLISSMRVGTVLPMEALDVVKVVNQESPSYQSDGNYSIGETVPYKFVVTNTSTSPVYQFQLSDPLIPAGIACQGNPTQLGAGQSVTCTGSLVVSDSQRTDGRITNTVTAQGATSATGSRNLSARSSVTVVTNPTANNASRVIGPGGTAAFQIVKQGSTLGLVAPDDATRLKLAVWNGSAWVSAPASGSTQIAASNGTWSVDATNKVSFVHNGTANYAVTPLKYRVENAFGGTAEATLSVTVTIVPSTVCTPEQQRSSARYWGFGNTGRFDFGASGSAAPGTGILPSLASTHGSFTVTDSKGTLLFVVDSGNGGANSAVIRTASGAAMAGSSTIGSALVGASPVTVIPAGQGTGKFFVVTTSATTSAAGQLSYRTVDMSQNGGLGSVSAATNFGSTNASTAVTAVPNADGTGYWVVNPERNSQAIGAYRFGASGYSGTAVSSTIAGGVGNASSNYEDIRFNTGLAVSNKVAQFAALAPNGNNNASVRLMTFNAATGALALVGQSRPITTTSGTPAYSVEFAPAGLKLYASKLGAGSSAPATMLRADVTTSSLDSFVSNSSGGATGGAVRLGPNGTMYWGQSGSNSVRTNTGADSGSTSWASLTLAGGTTSAIGLSNVLADCAIPAAEFALEKYASDGTTLSGGASFAVYPDNNGSPASTPATPGVQAVSGQAGKFTAKGLAPGAYWLRETTALPGHQLLAQDVLINVSLGGAIVIDAANNPQVKLVSSGSGANTTYTIKVTNTKSPALPLAGGDPAQWLTVGGIALLVSAVIGTAWWRRRAGARRPHTDLPIHDSLN